MNVLLLLLACVADDGGDVFDPRLFEDLDGDGFYDFEDCDDADADVFPGAAETCDQRDEDCDDVIDEEPSDGDTFYADADDDGFGDVSEVSCGLEQGYAVDGGDCDDGDPLVYPGAADDCDDVDSDCDGLVDEDEASVFYADDDGDGWGDADVLGCAQPSGAVTRDGDCDDGDPSVNPDAEDICDNGIDDDCDEAIDEGLTVYADVDGDGYGDAERTAGSCVAPSGYVQDATDCDDADADVHPGAAEACDDVDANCDGLTGTLVFVHSDASEEDWTEDAGEASAGSPFAVTLDRDGELQVCGGPWYLDASVETAAVSVVGQTERAGDVLAVSDGVLFDGVDASDLALQGLTLELEAGAVAATIPELTLTDVTVTGTAGTDPVCDATAVTLSSVSFSTVGVAVADARGQLVSATDLALREVEVDHVSLVVSPASAGDGVTGGLFLASTLDAEGLVFTDTSLELVGSDGVTVELFGGLVYADALVLADGEVADLVVRFDDSACTSAGCDLSAWGLGFASASLEVTQGDYELSVALAPTYSTASLQGGLFLGITSVVLDEVWSQASLSASEAYGAVAYSFQDLELTRTRLQQCSATTAGGALYSEGDLFLTGSTLSGSQADLGAGAYVSGALTCEDSELSSGTATTSGGGAYVEGDVSSTDCDWGEDTGDNSPDDLAGAASLVAAPFTFTCMAGACDTGL